MYSIFENMWKSVGRTKFGNWQDVVVSNKMPLNTELNSGRCTCSCNDCFADLTCQLLFQLIRLWRLYYWYRIHIVWFATLRRFRNWRLVRNREFLFVIVVITDASIHIFVCVCINVSGGGRYVQDDSVSRIDCCFDKTAVQCILYITRKPSCRQGRGATAYTVPVIVLTFKVIHGRWFSFYLKGRMPLPICDE